LAQRSTLPSFLSLDRFESKPGRCFKSICRAYLPVGVGLNIQSPSRGMTPAPFAPPDSFHGLPARARTEALMRRSGLLNESFVAAGSIATTPEKNL
jgi:hypothetical protein